MTDHQKEIEELLQRLSSGKGLETLYVQQMEWARHFNDLIWKIGGILVPISMAGFLLSFKDRQGNIDLISMFFTGVGSVMLLLFWNLLADWHRKLWNRCFVVTGLVEAEWGLRPPYTGRSDVPETASTHLLDFLTPRDYGPWLRWGLFVIVLVAWIFRFWLGSRG